MIDEGYIKFDCVWEEAPNNFDFSLTELFQVRNHLMGRKLIGVYEDIGIGYGNLSIRHPRHAGQFIISGTATGSINESTAAIFSAVTSYNIDQNKVWCSGPVKASSESMTHAAIYEADPSINCVIHVHSKKVWDNLLNDYPTTKKDVPYGTPAMAYEIKRLFTEGKLKKEPIIVMAGHEEGIVTFGKTIAEAHFNIQKYCGLFR